MDCRIFKENLENYITKNLDEKTKKEMDDHAKNCIFCNLILEQEKELYFDFIEAVKYERSIEKKDKQDKKEVSRIKKLVQLVYCFL